MLPSPHWLLFHLAGIFARKSQKMVPSLMARNTKGDQVVQCIVAEITPHRQMMDVQAFR
jgi:hypothetical protein